VSGWVRLYRGWRDSDFFDQFEPQPMSEREAWLWLLEHAAWKPAKRHTARGAPVDLAAGQIHVSDRSLASVFGWDNKRVRRFLRALEQDHMTDHQRDRDGTVLTIRNYARFQQLDARDGTTNGTATGTANGTTKGPHIEEGIRKEEAKPREAAMPQSLPRDAVMPDDLRRVMQAARITHPPSDASLLREWIRRGASLEAHILPVATRIGDREADRGKAIHKLKYLDEAVMAELAEERREIERLQEYQERVRILGGGAAR
jgi:predicted transcriptional regulator